MPNALPTKARTYLADLSRPITAAPALVAGDLLGYSIPAADLDQIAPNRRWQAGDTPAVRTRLIGLDDGLNPGASAASASVTLGVALTSGQGLKIEFPFAELVDKPAGIQVFVQPATGQPFYLMAQKALPAQYLWNNVAPTADVNIFIAEKPSGNEPTLDDFPAAAPSLLYGVKPLVFNFGLGSNGITLPFGTKTFNSETDGVELTYKYGANSSVKASVNPADDVQLENVLRRLGFRPTGNREGVFGAPLESTPPVMFWDMNIPWITTNAQYGNRLFYWGVTNTTLNEATLQAQMASKEAFELDFSWYKTGYIHQAYQVSYGRE